MLKRIYVAGNGFGSGKNWFSEKLSEKLKLPWYDQDDIAWKKKFTIPKPRSVKRKMLKKIYDKNKWIICGSGYSYIGKIPNKAQLIIFLNTSRVRANLSVVKRYFQRKLKGEYDSLRNVAGIIASKRSSRDHDFLKKMKKRFPKKTIILSNKQKNKFLKDMDFKSETYKYWFDL